MSDRYFVDRRCGCVAVRDREKMDPEENGLHPDMECVVRYWDIPMQSSPCPTCGHVRSKFSCGDTETAMAEYLADSMNAMLRDDMGAGI